LEKSNDLTANPIGTFLLRPMTATLKHNSFFEFRDKTVARTGARRIRGI
jgi:hypothetical protein